MSKCLDPFRFLLISLAVWMNQQWPTSPARSSHAVMIAATLVSVMTAATLVSVMNGWHAGGMRRVHDCGVSCFIRGVSRTLADSQIPKFRTEMQPLVELGEAADRVFGPYGVSIVVVSKPHALAA